MKNEKKMKIDKLNKIEEEKTKRKNETYDSIKK
jgi:hypothetical protein